MVKDRFEQWKQWALGKYINVDGWWGSQCVDAIMSYVEALFTGLTWQILLGFGNAKDIFTTANLSYFERIANDPNDINQLPEKGDIMVYDATSTNKFGHIGICDGADSGGVWLIQQDGFVDDGVRRTNNNESQVKAGDDVADGVCTRVYRPWSRSHCIGWLRPKLVMTTLLGYQRKAGNNGVNYRKSASTSGELIKEFAADEILDFKGFVRGELYSGNDIWFVGRYTGGYCWSGAFTDTATHDLPDITPVSETPAPTPEPQYSSHPTTGLFVIDVSSHNGDISWDDLKGTIDGAIIKVGHTGKSYGGNDNCTDPKFKQNQAAARRIGLEPHYYYYPYADEGAEQEAKRFMLGIERLQANEAIWVDIEDPDITEEFLQTFIETVEKLAQRQCHIYTFWAFATARPWLSKFAINGRKVIMAHYERAYDASVSDTPLGTTIGHQYSEKGILKGIEGNVDLNWINADAAQWRALGAHYEVPVEAPKPSTTDPTTTPQSDVESEEPKPAPKPETQIPQPTKITIWDLVGILRQLVSACLAFAKQNRSLTVNQPTAAPSAKIKAVGVAGGSVTTIVGIFTAMGYKVPEDASGAAIAGVSFIMTAVTFLAGYIKRDRL